MLVPQQDRHRKAKATNSIIVRPSVVVAGQRHDGWKDLLHKLISDAFSGGGRRACCLTSLPATSSISFTEALEGPICSIR